MSRSTFNVHRHIARREKAETLLATLRGLPDFPGRTELDSWAPESWEILALMAGVRVPSFETQQLVIELATAAMRRAS